MRNFNSSSSRKSSRSSTIAGRRYHNRSYGRSTQNSSYQQASVNIDPKNLEQPYILSIKSSATQLTGQILVNGKVIKQLNINDDRFDLSPYLAIGKNTIEILASYSPSLSLIEIALLGTDTRIVQQSSGTGILKHTLIVIVG
ncbi:hypothetical protein [Myxosarcina sp. GI1(2024)]